jgi:hypothetical protein
MPAFPPLDIPQAAPFLQATLEHSHVRASVHPSEDGSLDYDLAVPKSWAFSNKFGPAPTGPLVARALGFFAGGGEPGSPVIATTVTTVPFEIPIDAWARVSFANDGWNVVSAFWFPGANGLYFDITGTRDIDDAPEVRRSTVRVRGSDIFSLNCMCARKHWDHVKEVFWVAHSTFALAKPSDDPMEPCLEVSGHNPDFKIAQPNSWISEPVESPPEGVSALDIRLLDANAVELLGYVQVKAVRRADGAPEPSLDDRTQHALVNLARSGFTPDKDSQRPLTPEDDARSIAVEGWRGGVMLTGKIAGGDVSVRLGFIDRGNVSVTFSLLSPPVQANPLIALRTLRVWEIARATLAVSA